MNRIMQWICAAILVALAAAAVAQNYPTKPIRLIMPNAPGSANDTLGRIVAIHMGEALGQQIVLDNRAGAGGLLGMEIGKNGAPDGYTLVAASTATCASMSLVHNHQLRATTGKVTSPAVTLDVVQAHNGVWVNCKNVVCNWQASLKPSCT